MNTIANQTLANSNTVRSLSPGLAGDKIKLVPAPFSVTKSVATPAASENKVMPILATPNDLRDLIRFLKQKPDGVSIVEALGEIKKRILEPEKIQAYERWGIVIVNENRLQLSPLGWEFAQKLASEAASFCAVLDSIKPYRAMLELAQKQQLNLLMEADVAKFWRSAFPEFIQLLAPREVESGIVSFLHLCHAAELGSLTIGKRGQPARLRIDIEALNAYLSSSLQPALALAAVGSNANHKHVGEKIRVSISLSTDNSFVTPLLKLFSLLQIEGEIIRREQQETLINSARNFAALRSCNAGILVLTLADCVQPQTGEFELSPEAQMEISAAYLFYDRKIVLLHDARIQIPISWQGIRRCEFSESGISWENGLSLTTEIMQFLV